MGRDPAGTTIEEMSAADAIMAMEAKRRDALVSQDIPALERMLRDDLVHVHTTGIVQTKAQLINHATKILQFLEVERSDLVVRVFGDCAVMTGPMINTLRVVANGAVVKTHAFVTQLWVRENAQWQLASFHAVKLPDENAS